MSKLHFIALGLLVLVAACLKDETPPVSREEALAPVTTTQSQTPPAPPSVAGPKLPPVDQASADPAFQSFREKLLDAVRRRDRTVVLASIDPRIRTTFGEGGGVGDFEKLLAKEEMWIELETVLELGGTFSGEGTHRSFWAPYVFAAWPENEDSFESFAVIAEGVELRERPDATSPAIANLAYDIVKRVPDTEEVEGWRRVATADGRSGFVEQKNLRSPIDYRAGFTRSLSDWKMDAFVAGD